MEDTKKRKNWNYFRDKDREKVKGIFRFHEVPGGTLSFCYHAYKGDPVEKYDLIDGHTYELPLGVARHLNKNCNYPVHKYAIDTDGKTLPIIGSKVNRVSFQSLEFIDIEGLEVEKAGSVIPT